MNDRPNLCICLLTYNRREYVDRTLRSTLDNIHYSGRLAVHIADDGTGEEYRQWLTGFAGAYENVAAVGATDAARGGYGANYNLATQAMHEHSSIILPLEDDWELTRPLDLDPLVDALADERIGCLRLGILGFSRAYLTGKMAHIAGATYFLLDPDNEEPHVFSGQPRLETVEWERGVGLWPEGLDPNQTEFAVAHVPAARQKVAWPIDLIHPSGDLFAHIGTVRGIDLPREEGVAV